MYQKLIDLLQANLSILSLKDEFYARQMINILKDDVYPTSRRHKKALNRITRAIKNPHPTPDGPLKMEERKSLIAQLKEEYKYAYGAGIQIKNNLIRYAKLGIPPNKLQDFYPMRETRDGKVYTFDFRGWRAVGVR